jgi:hypothetical protein
MNRPSRIVRHAIHCAIAVLFFGAGAGKAQAEPFFGADVGLSVLSQEAHAPPICCAEREAWEGFGGRVGGRVGYRGWGWAFVRLDAGVAVHRATTRDDRQLSLVSPDVGFMLGAQTRTDKVNLDVAVGAGWRRFTGSATPDRFTGYDQQIEKDALDLRIAFGVHRALAGGHRLGGELALAKVMIAEHLFTLSLVYTWAAPG